MLQATTIVSEEELLHSACTPWSAQRQPGKFTRKVGEGRISKSTVAVMAAFTSGQYYNVLVATSIGEEGLDIGEVDLIVQFDAVASPIRVVQRMERFRKRNGKVLVLVNEGQVWSSLA